MKSLNCSKGLLLILALALFVSNSYGQDNVVKADTIRIQGYVIDENGEGMIGVTVIDVGTLKGSTTDADGKFVIEVKKGSKIAISYVGMSTLSFEAQEATNIKINVEEGLIYYCCTNHSPSHCALTIDEMQKLATKYNCTFK